MKKLLKLTALLLALTFIFGLTACNSSDSDWAYIKDKGTMVIGITEFAPANYYDESGTLVGFDTELAEAVCEEIGVKPVFQLIDWDSKELELDAKNIDCIWNMLSVTEDRKNSMDFSETYLKNHQVVVVHKNNAANYSGKESLTGTVAAEEGSAGETSVLADFANNEYIPVPGQSDALLEVMAGTVDFAVVDYTTAKSMCGEGTSYADVVMLEGVTLTDEFDAIGFRIGSDTTPVVNKALKKVFDSGKAAELAEKYGLSDLLQLGE